MLQVSANALIAQQDEQRRRLRVAAVLAAEPPPPPHDPKSKSAQDGGHASSKRDQGASQTAYDERQNTLGSQMPQCFLDSGRRRPLHGTPAARYANLGPLQRKALHALRRTQPTAVLLAERGFSRGSGLGGGDPGGRWSLLLSSLQPGPGAFEAGGPSGGPGPPPGSAGPHPASFLVPVTAAIPHLPPHASAAAGAAVYHPTAGGHSMPPPPPQMLPPASQADLHTAPAPAPAPGGPCGRPNCPTCAASGQATAGQGPGRPVGAGAVRAAPAPADAAASAAPDSCPPPPPPDSPPHTPSVADPSSSSEQYPSYHILLRTSAALMAASNRLVAAGLPVTPQWPTETLYLRLLETELGKATETIRLYLEDFLTAFPAGPGAAGRRGYKDQLVTLLKLAKNHRERVVVQAQNDANAVAVALAAEPRLRRAWWRTWYGEQGAAGELFSELGCWAQRQLQQLGGQGELGPGLGRGAAASGGELALWARIDGRQRREWRALQEEARVDQDCEQVMSVALCGLTLLLLLSEDGQVMHVDPQACAAMCCCFQLGQDVGLYPTSPYDILESLNISRLVPPFVHLLIGDQPHGQLQQPGDLPGDLHPFQAASLIQHVQGWALEPGRISALRDLCDAVRRKTLCDAVPQEAMSLWNKVLAVSLEAELGDSQQAVRPSTQWRMWPPVPPPAQAGLDGPLRQRREEPPVTSRQELGHEHGGSAGGRSSGGGGSGCGGGESGPDFVREEGLTEVGGQGGAGRWEEAAWKLWRQLLHVRSLELAGEEVAEEVADRVVLRLGSREEAVAAALWLMVAGRKNLRRFCLPLVGSGGAGSGRGDDGAVQAARSRAGSSDGGGSRAAGGTAEGGEAAAAAAEEGGPGGGGGWTGVQWAVYHSPAYPTNSDPGYNWAEIKARILVMTETSSFAAQTKVLRDGLVKARRLRRMWLQGEGLEGVCRVFRAVAQLRSEMLDVGRDLAFFCVTVLGYEGAKAPGPRAPRPHKASAKALQAHLNGLHDAIEAAIGAAEPYSHGAAERWTAAERDGVAALSELLEVLRPGSCPPLHLEVMLVEVLPGRPMVMVPPAEVTQGALQAHQAAQQGEERRRQKQRLEQLLYKNA